MVRKIDASDLSIKNWFIPSKAWRLRIARRRCCAHAVRARPEDQSGKQRNFYLAVWLSTRILLPLWKQVKPAIPF